MTFKYEIAECSKCGCEKLIVNRTHFLCDDCNKERLGKNKDPKKVQLRRTRLVSKTRLKSRKKINAKSNKQRNIDEAYKKTIEEISQEEEGVCSGCGTTQTLTNSHLVPRSRSRDLITVRRNIVKHCIQNGCHEKWESPRRRELLDYEENMEIVKELDPEYYRILKMKEDEYFRSSESS